jgi:hypothetical protein
MLDREEYIEQAYFFRTVVERLKENIPMQELLGSVREEILVTTKLPMAIDFLLTELKHTGAFAPAMRRLNHYFTPFQTYVIGEAENERGRFDLRVALEVLRREAEYRAGEPTPQAMFLYQFEALCRNRLGYDRGLAAIAGDPIYDDLWRRWILTIRYQVGAIDLADLIYVRSAHHQARKPASGEEPDRPVLFGEREGRIALANRHKDPLLLFAALHRQLDYPAVPMPEPIDARAQLLPQLLRRVEHLEHRLKLVEEEQKGGIDLTQFYEPPKK